MIHRLHNGVSYCRFIEQEFSIEYGRLEHGKTLDTGLNRC